MTDIEVINWLQKWWWVMVTVVGGALVLIVRNVIRIHEIMEAVKRVAEHDKRLADIKDQYEDIKGDTAELKESVEELATSLKSHVVEQKADFQSINRAVYAILDILKKGGDTVAADVAHQELRKHTLAK